jgi:hypothetical protein
LTLAPKRQACSKPWLKSWKEIYIIGTSLCKFSRIIIGQQLFIEPEIWSADSHKTFMYMIV